MYDQREKAHRDYEWAIAGALEEGLELGREEGREQGRKEGMYLGQVQLLQRLLGEAETSTADLLTLTPAQISELLDELQERLRSR